MTDEQELEFIELAVNGPRRVKTPEGAKFYGQPVGTIITPDMLAAAKAKNGGAAPPKGGLGSVKADAPDAPSSSKEIGTLGTKFDPRTGKMKPGPTVPVKSSTISGPNGFTLGDAVYSAPAGSKLVKPKKYKDKFAYVLTPDGEVHAFTQDGEAEISRDVAAPLAAKLKKLKGDDSLYEVEEFDASQEPKLSAQKPGAVLKTKSGKSAFVKQTDGTWENEDLGISLTDEDLQPAFDKGTYTVTPAHVDDVEDVDFSSMGVTEMTAALDDFPVGKELYGSPSSGLIMTKQEDGSWVSSITAKSLSALDLAELGANTDFLTTKAPVAPKETPAPAKKSSSKQDEEDVLLNPETAITPDNEQKRLAKANLATSAEVLTAEEGDVFFHPYFGILVKGKNGNWSYTMDDAPGEFSSDDIAASAKGNNISLKPWNVQQQEDFALWSDSQNVEIDESTGDDEFGAPGDPDNPDIPANALAVASLDDFEFTTGDKLWVDNDDEIFSLELSEKGEWIDSVYGMQYSQEDIETEVLGNTVYALPKNKKGAVDTDAGKVVEDVQELKDAPVGAVFGVKGVDITWTKISEDQWESSDEMSVLNSSSFMKGIHFGNIVMQPASAEVAGDDLEEDRAPALADIDPAALSKKQVEQLPVGTVAYFKKGTYTKTGADTWKGPWSTYSSTNMHASFVDDAGWSFKNPEDAEVEDALREREERPQEEPEVPAVVEDFPELQAIPQADVDSAIASLEAHTGFQIAYGLKSLPETHPLKDSDILEAVVAEAKNANPDLPPKKALVKHLKAFKGVPDEPVSKADEPADILIGDGESKTTQTGETGGSFTRSEVQDAIDILTSYEGKVFKSELNKYGNPLGKLSPNDIVGFNKDKLVTKQKFIDYLKGALADYDSKNESSSSDAPAEEESSGSQVPGEKVPADPDMTALKAAPVGSSVRWQSAAQHNVSDVYVKQDDETWETASGKMKSSDGIFFYNSAVAGMLTWAEKPEEVETPVETGFKPGQVLSVEEMDSLPAGSVVHGTLSEINYTKLEDGDWKPNVNGGKATYPSAGFLNPKGESLAAFVSSPDVSEEEVESETDSGLAGLKPGDSMTKEQLDSAPVGTVVGATTNSDTRYIKEADGKWKPVGSTYGSFPSDGFFGPGGESYAIFNHGPSTEAEPAKKEDFPGIEAEAPDVSGDVVPEYQKIPESNEVQAGVPQGEKATAEFVKKAPAFTQLTLNEDGLHMVWQKQASGNWQGYDLDANSTWSLSGEGMEAAVVGPSDILTVPTPQNPHQLHPGKYTKGGKAFLYINSDGTGVYQGLGGKLQALDVPGVKKRWDEGFNLYVIDKVGPPSVPAEGSVKAKPSTKKSVGSIDELPDGTYYTDLPDSAKAQVYVVNGDVVTHTKPLTAWNDIKVGTKPTGDFVESAPVGTKLTSSYFSAEITKTENGWVNTVGNATSPPTGWYVQKYKIASLGNEEPVEVTKASLKTKFLSGKLLDSTGTSVLPKNYSGSLKWFGVETNALTLLDAKKNVDEAPAGKTGTALSSAGLKAMSGPLAKEAIIGAYGEYNPENTKKFFSEHIGAMLDSLDTSVPESDAASLFEYNSLGQPVPPAGLVAQSVPYYYDVTNGQATQVVKDVAALFGDGKTIGQLPTTMTKQQKISWVESVKAGNFAKAYSIELAASATSGKSLPKGYAHPGYPDNTETHNMTWAPAVPGELAAGEKIEGEWSSPQLDWSLDEVNNYLIKSQMQNPTHLSNAQKVQWVKYHINGKQEMIDQLSVQAKLSADAGNLPVSDPISWTDDIKPAKTYDKLFYDTDAPLTWKDYGNGSAALDWFNDNKEQYPELKTDAVKHGKEQWGLEEPFEDWGSSYQQVSAKEVVQRFFQKKHDDIEAQKLIPVYTKESGQTKGSHPGAFYTDQFGKKYYAKWWDYEDQLSNYRLEIEHSANKIGRAFGYSTADSKLLTQDNHYMQMQNVVPGVGDMSGFNYSTISAQMLADVEGEHMLDWLLQNDDTKEDNAIVTADGRVVGIDKARSFKNYGAVAWDHDAPDGNQSIYTKLYAAIQSGKVSKETLDAAYVKIVKQARRIQKKSDARFLSLIEEGSKNRTSWEISYSVDGKPVSADVEGLKAAFVDQKSKLVDKVQQEWSKLYSKAGHGDLPEVPEPKLAEGIISGLDSPELHEQVFQAKASGKTAMVGGSSVIGGTVLVWNEKDSDGKDRVMGEMFLAPKAQEKALSFFTQHASDTPAAKSGTAFMTYDSFGSPLVSGAKTINTHVSDQSYNESTIADLKTAYENLKKEREEWDSGLDANSDINGLPAYMFSSTGTKVPLEHMSQYKLMLDFYEPQFEGVIAAYESKGSTNMVNTYTQIAPAATTETLTSPDGSETMVSMADSKWLVSGPAGIELKTFTKEEIDALKSTWSSTSEAETTSTPLNAVYQKNFSQFESMATLDPKTNEKASLGYSAGAGTGGSEFQATLPTGERIFWRNASHTQTARGQHGKLSFQFPDTSTPDAVAVSMARVQEFLDVVGIESRAADTTDAELTYWREMYTVLENRNHKSEGSKKFGVLRDKMYAKAAELKVQNNVFLESLSEVMSPDEEVDYWRDLWRSEFGSKVDEFVENDGFLPKFDHQNIQDPELTTGKPYWERFDVTLEELLEKDYWIGHSSGSTPGDNGEIESGGLISGEERLRQLGKIFTGGGYGESSAVHDQSNGSSHQIYTRLVSGNAKNMNYYNYIMNPALLLRTRTYVLTGDQYGKLDARKSDTESDLSDLIDTHKDAGGELMTPHMASVLDGVEFIVFDEGTEKKREAQIQKLKALGLETIRGLPVEERLIMRSNLQSMIAKVKASWKQKS